ncbi:MAG: DedA family protein [Dehalococcoidia bacterium]|nr:DedA family protein [Dehalococcoidia bacterium]
MLSFATNVANDLNVSHPAFLLLVFAITALGEAGIPFPLIMQGLLVFTGYKMTQENPLSTVPLLGVALLGSVSGANAIYWVSRFAGGRLFANPRLSGIFKHRWLLRAQGIAEKQRPWAIATGRLIPGMLTPVSVASGAMKVPWTRFIVGVGLSEIIWVTPLVAIGVVAGHTARSLDWTLSTYPKAITLIVVVIGLYFVARFLWRRLRANTL